ncbi:hypothetical protein Dhaf_1105 [Desulfitobacterium hafniense DCB-2]|uniref:Uncharacterized protein n=1 Tax=Desulfitobacterium hafniense (strain DSM 10664 / DCB-2) TaxID=272564 RepID=B8FZU1_DESHD|nr:hypothetical protein [Desulfitobacterium hafniense]ACL19165.1 hypothetical protein Dhaf_1105 [Desulfitobacterium hafniense DCB-2]
MKMNGNETEECCHDHQHHQTEQRSDNIESHRHNDALVCSGNRNIIGDLEVVKKKLRDEMGMFAEWVEKRDGIIGHIKASIEVSGPAFVLSTTGGEVSSREVSSTTIHVSIVVIVFQMDKQKTEDQIEALLDKL